MFHQNRLTSTYYGHKKSLITANLCMFDTEPNTVKKKREWKMIEGKRQ